MDRQAASRFVSSLFLEKSQFEKNSLVLQGRPAKRRSLTLHQIRCSASGSLSEILTIGGVDDST